MAIDREPASRTILSILQADATPDRVHKIATDAMQNRHAGVVVAPIYVSRVATMLRGSGASVVAAVSYPGGFSKPTVKAIEATSCIKDGAGAVLIVPHFPHVIRNDFASMRAELLEIVRAARATRRDVVIHVSIAGIANHLDETTIATACRAIRESGCDGIVIAEQLLAAAKQHAESLAVLAVLPSGDLLT